MKKNTIIISGSILGILVLLLGGILGLQQLLATSETYIYGPYDCGGKQLLVKQDVTYNRLEGVAKTTHIEVNFGEYSFSPFVYPSLFTKAENDVVFEGGMDESQMSQYRMEHSSMSMDLRTDIMDTIIQKYHAENSRYPENLVSKTPLDSVDFLDFKKCFDTNIEDIYTNMILKTQDKHLGTSVSQYIKFLRVYNTK